MRCVSPLSLKDPRGRSAGLRVIVPCGRCGACRSNRRADWSFRLKEEFRVSKNAFFVTLTYSDENLVWADDGPTLVKSDLQKFWKRLRKCVDPLLEWNVRYYAVGEYGSRTFRPHYHAVVYNLPLFVRDRLQEVWRVHGVDIGGVHVVALNDATIHYVTKYHVNRGNRDLGCRAPEFCVMSRNPGIGVNYVSRAGWWNRDHGLFVMNNGFRQRLPRYYRDRIFGYLSREKFAALAVLEGDEAYKLEVERLDRKSVV